MPQAPIAAEEQEVPTAEDVPTTEDVPVADDAAADASKKRRHRGQEVEGAEPRLSKAARKAARKATRKVKADQQPAETDHAVVAINDDEGEGTEDTEGRPTPASVRKETEEAEEISKAAEKAARKFLTSVRKPPSRSPKAKATPGHAESDAISATDSKHSGKQKGTPKQRAGSSTTKVRHWVLFRRPFTLTLYAGADAVQGAP